MSVRLYPNGMMPDNTVASSAWANLRDGSDATQVGISPNNAYLHLALDNLTVPAGTLVVSVQPTIRYDQGSVGSSLAEFGLTGWLGPKIPNGLPPGEPFTAQGPGNYTGGGPTYSPPTFGFSTAIQTQPGRPEPYDFNGNPWTVASVNAVGLYVSEVADSAGFTGSPSVHARVYEAWADVVLDYLPTVNFLAYNVSGLSYQVRDTARPTVRWRLGDGDPLTGAAVIPQTAYRLKVYRAYATDSLFDPETDSGGILYDDGLVPIADPASRLVYDSGEVLGSALQATIPAADDFLENGTYVLAIRAAKAAGRWSPWLVSGGVWSVAVPVAGLAALAPPAADPTIPRILLPAVAGQWNMLDPVNAVAAGATSTPAWNGGAFGATVTYPTAGNLLDGGAVQMALTSGIGVDASTAYMGTGIGAVAGRRYTFVARCWDNTANPALLQIAFVDGSGAAVGFATGAAHYRYLETTEGAVVHQLVAVSGVAPAGTVSADLYLIVNHLAAGGSIRFGRFAFYEGPVNTAANPRFSADTSGWTPVNGTLTRSGTGLYGAPKWGDWCGKLTVTAAGTAAVEASDQTFARTPPVRAGDTVGVGVWVQCQPWRTVTLQLRSYTGTAATTTFQATTTVATITAPVDAALAWFWVGGDVTVPAGATRAALRLQVTGAAAGEQMAVCGAIFAPGGLTAGWDAPAGTYMTRPTTALAPLPSSGAPTLGVQVQRSVDGGVTWSGATVVPDAEGQDYADWEAPQLIESLYRARATAAQGAYVGAGPWMPVPHPGTAVPRVTRGWLVDPLHPTSGTVTFWRRKETLDETVVERQATFYPIGSSSPVVVYDTVLRPTHNLRLLFVGQADYDAFTLLRARQTVLLWRADDGLDRYVRLGGDVRKATLMAADRPTRPVIQVDVTAVEVDPP